MKRSSLNSFELLLGILLMSTSGIFGRILDLPAPVIIWLRCLIAAVIMFAFFKVIGKDSRLPPGRVGRLIILSGLLMTGHWVTYFYSLQYANVAIGMLALFTYPLITVVLEPIFLKTKLKIRHVILCVIAFVGVYFLVPEFSLGNDVTFGLVIGLISAVIYAFRNIIVKMNMANVSGEVLMFQQLVVILVVLTPSLWLLSSDHWIHQVSINWQGLLFLSIVTTAFGHSLFVRSFRHFQMTSIALISNLTPLFGILIAWVVIAEVPQGNVILGGSIILATTVIEILISSKQN